MFTREIKITFEKEICEIDKYVGQPCYEEFKKMLKNHMVEAYTSGNKEKGDVSNELLTFLYMLENEKKAGHL